jgi:hypothetical protein
MYILPRFGHQRATVSRATAHALSAFEAKRALHADAGRVLLPARPVVGRATQAYSALWPGCDRPSMHCACGPSSVSAQKPFKNKKFIFYFLFGFKLNSYFKKLYLNIQSSKNDEISSVGFIIF